MAEIGLNPINIALLHFISTKRDSPDSEVRLLLYIACVKRLWKIVAQTTHNIYTCSVNAMGHSLAINFQNNA